MNVILTLVNQTVTMFLLIGVGFCLFRTGKITESGSKALGNILIYGALPAVIISGFLQERTPERLAGLAFSALGAAVILALSILCARVCFKKNPISHFAAAFSNPGFFAVPLILASIGTGGVFYIASFIAFLNLLQWTYGVAVMTGQTGGLQVKSILKAPFMVAIIIGLSLFLTGIPVPGVISKALNGVKELNTPLAMFTVGAYLAQTDIPGMLRRREVYMVALVRLILIPLLTVVGLMLVPQTFYDMKFALLVASACPVGSNVAVYAQLHGKDYTYAVETVIISILLSILTIPLMVMLAQMLW